MLLKEANELCKQREGVFFPDKGILRFGIALAVSETNETMAIKGNDGLYVVELKNVSTNESDLSEHIARTSAAHHELLRYAYTVIASDPKLQWPCML